MKTSDIDNILTKINASPSKWELDTIIYHDRTSNPTTLSRFLNRIKFLQDRPDSTEYQYLVELLDDMDEADCLSMLNRDEDEEKIAFIEDLARTSAIEILTGGKINFETMNTACKLSPNDFILCAKRTQDLITAIQGLVVKGETLSEDVAGA